ncbi:MAG: hypothetical protein KAH01_06260 [Caldisericia bacterium]|nr:hypothetical protein [Caldisericia bacterium]
MKYFSFSKALKDGFYFLSETARKSTIIWIVFFVIMCLSVSLQFVLEPFIEQFVTFYGNLLASKIVDTEAILILPQFSGLFYLYVFCVSLVTTYLTCLVTKSAIILIRYPDFVVNKDSLKISFKVFLNYVWVSILFTSLVITGYLLLIIPAFVWLVTYRFSEYFLLEKEKGTVYSFSMSRKLTTGIRWKLFFSIFLTGILVALFSSLLQSISMNHQTVAHVLSGFINAFVLYYMAFFFASIYRQLIENYKLVPSMDPEFVKQYFIVRYSDDNNEEITSPNEE